MQDILWLILRRLRLPLILLLLVYSLSVIGMTLVPGQAPDGSAYTLSYLEAAYFVAFMSTTIGFGEIPYVFTGAQRLFTYLIIFPNVGVWLYSIGAIIGLFLEDDFQRVFRRSRFRSRVERLVQPFWLVAGYGHTGRLVAESLQQRGIRSTVLEIEPGKVARMSLDPGLGRPLGLAADAREYDNLIAAGLNHPCCRGVIATTDDDKANLKIAISAKLPAHETESPDGRRYGELQVLARCERDNVAANMDSFGTDAIVDPFAVFAERFRLLLEQPETWLVQDWLLSVPGSELRNSAEAPSGHWIVCGGNAFGTHLIAVLEDLGLPYILVEERDALRQGFDNAVAGRGTGADTLEAAGIQDAVGIIAGTGDDVDNLSIILTARELKPGLFTIVRQEKAANSPLFNSLGADVVAQRSLIIARRLLLLAAIPLAPVFMSHLVRADAYRVHQLRLQLDGILEGRAPDLWTLELSADNANVLQILKNEYAQSLKLDHLRRPVRRADPDPLPAVCLLHERGGSRKLMPAPELELQTGDRLLFAGRQRARTGMEFALAEVHGLLRVVTDRHAPRSALARRLAGAGQADRTG